MNLYINAFAHYLPEGKVPNAYFKDVNGLDDEWIYSRTGIRNRSKALEGENTNTMAVEAVRRLKERLPFPIEEVDLIVAATYSPYDTVRTAAHTVQRVFDIADAKCLSVSSACSSFINALEIAEGYFAMGKATKAIVLASEHNTKYANETDLQALEHGEQRVGQPSRLFDAEYAVVHSVLQYRVQQFQFQFVDVFPQRFDFAVVVEVSFFDSLASSHEFGNQIEPFPDIQFQPFVGGQGRLFCLFEFLLYQFRFLFHDVVENHLLTVKMRVKSASAHAGGKGDIFHRCFVKT